MNWNYCCIFVNIFAPLSTFKKTELYSKKDRFVNIKFFLNSILFDKIVELAELNRVDPYVLITSILNVYTIDKHKRMGIFSDDKLMREYETQKECCVRLFFSIHKDTYNDFLSISKSKNKTTNYEMRLALTLHIDKYLRNEKSS